MSPTECSARKNVKLEPYLEGEREGSTFTTEIDNDADAKYKENLLNSGAVFFSPPKNSLGYLTAEKIKKFNSTSHQKSAATPESEFFVTKTSKYEGGSRPGNMTTTNSRNRKGIIEFTKETTTSYSPNARKMDVVHDNITKCRKACCSAKRLMEPMPTKTIKTRSKSYQFTNPDPIRIEYDDKEFFRIKKVNVETLASHCESKHNYFESMSKSTRKKVKFSDIDVENSEANNLLGKLFCKRTEEAEYLKGKSDGISSRSITDMRKYLNGLKQEIENKKDKSNELKNQSDQLWAKYEEYNENTEKQDPTLKIDEKNMNDLEGYIKQLYNLRDALQDSERLSPGDKKYEENFKNRHDALVKNLDSNGIALNDKLTGLLKDSEDLDQRVADRESEVKDKRKERDGLTKEVKKVDDTISDVSEKASVRIHKMLQELGKVLKNKGDLSKKINSFESDIIEYNAIFRELKGGSDNVDILKNRNNVIDKKKQMLHYLNIRLKNADGGYEKTKKALDFAMKFEYPNFNTSDGTIMFGEHIDDLKSELGKARDLENYLQLEIEKRNMQNGYKDNQEIDTEKLKEAKDNLEKLKKLMAQLLKLHHEEYAKVREIKILEAKLILDGYGNLEGEKNDLQNYLTKVDKMPKQADKPKNDYKSDDLIAQIEQYERRIVQLVNQLRNLDDKILYLRTNQEKLSKFKKNEEKKPEPAEKSMNNTKSMLNFDSSSNKRNRILKPIKSVNQFKLAGPKYSIDRSQLTRYKNYNESTLKVRRNEKDEAPEEDDDYHSKYAS